MKTCLYCKYFTGRVQRDTKGCLVSEGEENKTQILPASNGFHQHTNHGESGIKRSYDLYDVKLIQSARNLKSHLDKILSCIEPEYIEITATHWTEKDLEKEAK